MTTKYISSSTAIPTFLAKNNTIECQANRAGKFLKKGKIVPAKVSVLSMYEYLQFSRYSCLQTEANNVFAK